MKDTPLAERLPEYGDDAIALLTLDDLVTLANTVVSQLGATAQHFLAELAER